MTRLRGSSNVDGVVIESTGEVQVPSGLLELDGNDIGGTQVTIADDAVASITPPRTGGFMFMSANGNSDYPQSGLSSYFLYDTGASFGINDLLNKTYVDAVTTDVTGTTGVDGNVTVGLQYKTIKIENRSGQSRTFQITFL